jgi:NAD(P)H-dependent FMN reductase
MSKIMIIVGSVRPGRIGLPIATWVQDRTLLHGGFEVDFVDLAELALPFMDEPNHPRAKQYTQQHTLDWSARVEAADGFIFVTPEYNHSYSPALKNALDYLSLEWWRKPVGIVSYGGVSSGTRGVVGLEPVLLALGLVRIGAAVEIPFAGAMLGNGKFSPSEKVAAILDHVLSELEQLSTALKPTRQLG